MSVRLVGPAALFALAATACIAPSVVHTRERAVSTPTAAMTWTPASADDLRGLFESIAIEGEAAASLWKVEYVFADDGTYSGAALVLERERASFQTLSGAWRMEDAVLDLGEGQTARASVAPGHLKLETDGGVAILRRAEIQ